MASGDIYVYAKSYLKYHKRTNILLKSLFFIDTHTIKEQSGPVVFTVKFIDLLQITCFQLNYHINECFLLSGFREIDL